MKQTFLFLSGIFAALMLQAQDTSRSRLTDTLMLENIEILATRAIKTTPITQSNLSSEQIEKMNLGQDLPFMLNQIPSVVINADAGNGFGYTGIRLRGSDASRINVTLNGIPYNDAESQGTFFVDMPDVLSSVNSIQVQRGVGTSSNGAGAFGGSINLSTNSVNKERYAELNNSIGSFNTIKNTIKVGTGVFAKHFTVDGRVSGIKSDGYIDRASSNLRSLYFSAAYVDANSSLRFNILNGKEKTYQAWYGVAESLLQTDRTNNPAGTEKPGDPYKNETDNYTQTHYQLFYNRKVNTNFQYNTSLFLTRGKGYYEQYKAGESFAKYQLPVFVNGGDTIENTDLIRQLWLDNYYYGMIVSGNYQAHNTSVTFGGGYTRYDGKHFGKVIWSDVGNISDYKYYDLDAFKTDLNAYVKLLQTLGNGFSAFLDLQGRFVDYRINGFRDNPGLTVDKNYEFFNPKAGISFNRNYFRSYLSYSIGSKEPNRDDFEANNDEIAKPEILRDLEIGIENANPVASYAATFYYMNYKDQLVTTGKINDVGAYTRTNTPHSYRLGIELEGAVKLNSWMNVAANMALSKNKIKEFTEYVDDYDNGGQLSNSFKNTDISFSPQMVAGGTVTLKPVKNGEINLLSKYVSRQFLDNTSNESRSLDPYFTEDVRFSYTLFKKFFKEINFILQVNNIFNKKYEPNGYTYNYFYGGKLSVENYYFPMAGTNVLAAINIKL